MQQHQDDETVNHESNQETLLFTTTTDEAGEDDHGGTTPTKKGFPFCECRLETIASWAFTVGAIGTALYAIFVYGILTQWVVPLGATVHPLMQAAFQTEKPFIYLHALCSACALALGPFQVIPSFRRRFMRFHRWAGRAYFFFALVGSTMGIVCAQHAQGHTMGRVGFTTLGCLWLLSNLVGFVTIAFSRIRKVMVHRWSTEISVTLAYAAVSLRLMLPLAIYDPPNYALFERNYGWIAWACWVGNLIIYAMLKLVLWIMSNRRQKKSEQQGEHDGVQAAVLKE